MLSTADYCAILTALGGTPASLPDMTEKTLVNAIFAQIKSNDTNAVTGSTVSGAIVAMTTEQKNAVKTALGIS